MPDDSTLSAEDAKLVTLARTSRARNSSAEGAAVRDRDGRTYVATAVDLPSLRLSALQTAVAMAVSSGATGLEAAVVVGEDPQPDVAVVRDLAGADVVVHLADPAGRPQATVRT
jgi:cytidine deaminase